MKEKNSVVSFIQPVSRGHCTSDTVGSTLDSALRLDGELDRGAGLGTMVGCCVCGTLSCGLRDRERGQTDTDADQEYMTAAPVGPADSAMGGSDRELLQEGVSDDTESER